MKNFTIGIIILTMIYSCGILIPFPESKKYPTTTFYVKNNSNKSINFKATVLKRNSNGYFNITNTFTALPKDSILVRQVGYKKGTEYPQNWFSDFSIFPIDGVKLNDPNLAENWIKGVNEKGKPTYTFIIAE